MLGTLDQLIASIILAKYPTEIVSKGFTTNRELQSKIENKVDKYIKKISFWKDIVIVFKSFFKAFVKKDDIDRKGFDTDEDYGDHLLRINKITKNDYDQKILKAKEMLRAYGR